MVLEWAEQRLGWNYPEFIDSSELTTVFGNQTSNRLAKWLRHRVLIRAEDSWIPGDQSYAYTISRDGVELIQGKLGLRSRPAP